MFEISQDRVRDLEPRARAHQALSDAHRVLIAELLHESDRTPGDLAEMTGMPSNLMAFHLKTLEEAGLVERRRSEGDSRRRYVCLREEGLRLLGLDRRPPAPGSVVFVCTHNSARSQLSLIHI